MNYSTSSQKLMEKVLNGDQITFDEAEWLLDSENIFTLARCANEITRNFNGDKVDVESLINAKSGHCPEDCSFCAQSSFYDTGITTRAASYFLSN